MLKDNLYHIIATKQQKDSVIVTLQLLKGHSIFAGHFPGQPVLPGACILDIVREILSTVLESKHQLKKATSLKFVAPINPRITPDLELKLTYKTVESGLQVTANLSANSVVCFKMQGKYGVL